MEKKMETQLRMQPMGGKNAAPVSVDARNPTAKETCQLDARMLREARALAEIALRTHILMLD